MANVLDNGRSGLVLIGEATGHVLIPRDGPLTRLNYFDGKLLRAEDLRAEQEYVRRLVQLSNQAGGDGVVHGFDLELRAGDRLRVGAGLALDGVGRVLLLPSDADVGVAALLAASRRGDPPAVRRADDGSGRFVACRLADGDGEVSGVPGQGLYLIVASHAEALCGHEDVYGRLCERACETDSERPYRVEGISLRAVPLTLGRPLPRSSALALDRRHLRSRVASAFFREEDGVPGPLLSRAGLTSGTWCRGAEEGGDAWVPLGVLARQGETTLFLDAWTARRERMESPPRGYWAGRMAMRPWNAYLAQILHFQCHLGEVLRRGPVAGGGDDPCREEKEALAEARRYLRELEDRLARGEEAVEEAGAGGAARTEVFERAFPGGLEALTTVSEQMMTALRSFRAGSGRILLDGGIVELPPAGYLPVDPASGTSVNRQVRELVGEGVDLRFCVVRPDFVAHALEEAQHMERISLLEGLDDPGARPEVDVLVPGGAVRPGGAAVGAYDATVVLTPSAALLRAGAAKRYDDLVRMPMTHRAAYVPPELPTAGVRGVARAQDRSGGGGVLRWAGSVELQDPALVGFVSRLLAQLFAGPKERRVPGAAELEGELHAPAATVEGVEMLRAMAAARVDVAATAAQGRELELGAWAEVEYDRDPFGASAGERIDCSVKLTVGARARRETAAAEIRAEGTLAVVEGGGSETARVVEGVFPRVVVLVQPTRDGEPRPVRSESLRLDARMELRGGGGEATQLVLGFEAPGGRRITVAGVRRGARVDGDLELTLPRGSAGESTIEVNPKERPFTLSGTVVRADDGSPISGAEVALVRDGNVLRTASTDAAGQVEIRDVGEGPVEVVVRATGMRDARTQVDFTSEAGFIVDARLAAVAGGGGAVTLRPARAAAERTERVLANDDPAHRRAAAGLALIGQALGDDGFRARAEADLFDREGPAEGVAIAATRDWVLFHRRRRKTCAPRPEGTAPTRDRRYRLYHVDFATEGDDGETAARLDEARAALQTGDVATALALLDDVRAARDAPPLTSQEPREVAEAIEAERERLDTSGPGLDGLIDALRSTDPTALEPFAPAGAGTVTFSGDGVSLTTPESVVLEQWRGVGPRGAILLGAIATRDDAPDDGVVLTEGRLDRLEATLAGVTPLAPAATSIRLDVPPPGLEATGADGVVVIASGGVRPEAPTQVTTHLVVAATGSRGRLAVDAEELEDGITEEMLAEMGVILGRVSFEVGALEPDPEALQALRAAWNEAFSGLRPGAASAISAEGDGEPREAQAAALVRGLGGAAGARVFASTLPASISLPADAVTFLAAGRERRGRLVVFEAVEGDREILLDSPSLVVDFNVSGALMRPLSAEQRRLLQGVQRRFARVEVAVPEAAPDPLAQQRAQAVRDELGAGGLLAENAVGRVGALRDEDEELLTVSEGDAVDEVVFLQVERG